jgi:hypothetical protein|tara:strand:- start:1829 stop:2014 length:186 start_codon:yes stop_codon:yes gene_type:complete
MFSESTGLVEIAEPLVRSFDNDARWVWFMINRTAMVSSRVHISIPPQRFVVLPVLNRDLFA